MNRGSSILISRIKFSGPRRRNRLRRIATEPHWHGRHVCVRDHPRQDKAVQVRSYTGMVCLLSSIVDSFVSFMVIFPNQGAVWDLLCRKSLIDHLVGRNHSDVFDGSGVRCGGDTRVCNAQRTGGKRHQILAVDTSANCEVIRNLCIRNTLRNS